MTQMKKWCKKRIKSNSCFQYEIGYTNEDGKFNTVFGAITSYDADRLVTLLNAGELLSSTL